MALSLAHLYNSIKIAANHTYMHIHVDEYISNATMWKDEMELLRHLLLQCGLTEEWKWKQPCYTFQGKNVIIIGPFKKFCALAFFKGVLLSDTHQLLVRQGKNTEASRIIPFTSIAQIRELSPVLETYIYEAIEVEKSGVKVLKKEDHQDPSTPELILAFENDLEFKKAFKSLTPGRQRAYHIYFSAAKQAATRADRISTYKQRIMDGYGFHDCVCGHSKRPPTCDGSHKNYR